MLSDAMAAPQILQTTGSIRLPSHLGQLRSTTSPASRARSASTPYSPKTALSQTTPCWWVRRTWPSRCTRVPSVRAAPHWGQHKSSTSICLVMDTFLRAGHHLLQAGDAEEHAVIQRGFAAHDVFGVGGTAGGAARRAVLAGQHRQHP